MGGTIEPFTVGAFVLSGSIASPPRLSKGSTVVQMGLPRGGGLEAKMLPQLVKTSLAEHWRAGAESWGRPRVSTWWKWEWGRSEG